MSNRNLREHADWVTEFYLINSECNGDLVSHMDKLAESDRIHNRLTILYAGIFCPEDIKSKARVNRWLKQQMYPKLTHRNHADALFLYAYEALKGLSNEGKNNEFKQLIKEYLNWIKKKREEKSSKIKPLLEKQNQLSALKETIKSAKSATPADKKQLNKINLEAKTNQEQLKSEKELYSTIKTFGDLHDALERNSITSGTMTMHTKPLSGKNAEDKIAECMKNKLSLTDFLNYLDADEATKDYNRKATYYAQRMLYEMLKFSLDILYKHNLPLEEERRNAYLETRAAVLAHENNDRYFNRFINYNRLYLDGLKKDTLKQYCIETTKAGEDLEKNLAECITTHLKDSPISYSRIFSNIYSFYMTVSCAFQTSRLKDLTKKGETAKLKADLPNDRYEAIYGKKDDCRTTMASRICDYISGNMYVSRSFLILFGFYAGYNKERLNNALENSDFAQLDEETPLDKLILNFLEQDYMTQIRDAINTKKFIQDIRDSYKQDGSYIGFEERNNYNGLMEDLQIRMKDVLKDSPTDELKKIFAQHKVKNSLEHIETELKKMK